MSTQARSMTLGRIQLVARDLSLDAIPGPHGKAASRAAPIVAPDASTAPLPDAGWSKDIRDYYNAVMQEPVPQELLDLLARIAADKAE
jgi:hypothetical protein